MFWLTVLSNVVLYGVYGFQMVVPRMVEQETQHLIEEWKFDDRLGRTRLYLYRKWRFPDIPERGIVPVERLRCKAAGKWMKFTVTWLPWLVRQHLALLQTLIRDWSGEIAESVVSRSKV